MTVLYTTSVRSRFAAVLPPLAPALPRRQCSVRLLRWSSSVAAEAPAPSQDAQSKGRVRVAYDRLAEAGNFVHDRSQLRIVRALDRMGDALENYSAPKVSLVEKQREASERSEAGASQASGLSSWMDATVGTTMSIMTSTLSRSLAPMLQSKSPASDDGTQGSGEGNLVLTKLELLGRPDLVAIDGVLYDIASFMPKHPGGAVIQNVGGTDGTAVFKAAHSDVMIRRSAKILEKYKVGRLAGSSEESSEAKESDSAEVESFFPRGLYIWGGPGTGKTALTQMFFDLLPLEKKRRVHFHQFMIEIHQKQHKLKSQGLGEHIFLAIADEVSEDCHVLLLDEFMVSDVADAMVIGQIFNALWRAGVVVIATSNREPGDLYQNGIQRHLFLPFVDELERRCKVVRIRSEKDYRMEAMVKERARISEMANETEDEGHLFMVRSLGSDRNADADALWEKYTAGCHVGPRPYSLGYKRSVVLENVCVDHAALRVSFKDLCGEAEQPMGVADYLALATEFQVILVDDMPQLDFADLDTLRRWISFVDIAYDEHIVVAIDAEKPIDELIFDHGLSEAELAAKLLGSATDIMGDEYLAQTVHDLDNPGDVQYQVQADQQSIDELFAVNRMRSRLHEMQTYEYVKRSDASNKDILLE